MHVFDLNAFQRAASITLGMRRRGSAPCWILSGTMVASFSRADGKNLH
jgi:hypothetical protein